MKIVGVIAEYNPFHNGHQYHLQETKKETGADYIIVIMSGNFVQRGGPTIIDKYSRTKAALSSGVDLVIELPVIYSTGSAQYFALGAVSLLHKLGCIDYLCFGSENGDIRSLSSISSYLLFNQKDYDQDINTYMKTGITFPEARQLAIKKNNPQIDDDIISSPNNILGIEYIKALMQLKSDIEPFAINRRNAQYHESNLNFDYDKPKSSISSATALRNEISKHSSIASIENHLPNKSFEIMKNQLGKTFPIYDNDFSLMLNYKLLEESNESLSQYIDVSEDLANRILNIDFTKLKFNEFAKKIKTKQWTLTRINRVLTHILLNLKTENLEIYNKHHYSQYARVLGFNKNATSLLRIIKEKATIPIITKISHAHNELDQIGMKMLEEDIFAADVYNLIINERFTKTISNEYKQELIII